MHTLSKVGIVAIIVSLCCVVRASAQNGVSHGPRQDFIGVFFVQAVALPHPDPIRCSDPSYPNRIDFSGVAYTNLGRATFTQSHCEGEDNETAHDGEEVITFANGEILYGAYSASVIVTPTTGTDGRVIIEGTYRNTGGTGSLKHAHGRGISTGVFNTFNGAGQIAVTGTL
jgi:hypothetical protein